MALNWNELDKIIADKMDSMSDQDWTEWVKQSNNNTHQQTTNSDGITTHTINHHWGVEQYQTRIVTKFLALPKTINGKRKWLKKVSWIERRDYHQKYELFSKYLIPFASLNKNYEWGEWKEVEWSN